MKFNWKPLIIAATLAIGVSSMGILTLSASAQDKSSKAIKTVAGLKKAYLGETTACGKYMAYALAAEKEGLPGIAHLFRATSDAEAIHARNHGQVLATLGITNPESGSYNQTPHSTRENLKEAVQGETYERDTMYPEMLKDARAERQPGAIRTLTFAREAERQHATLYSATLKTLAGSKPKSTAAGRYFVCQDCGATYFGKAPALCIGCKAPKSLIVAIE